MSYEMNKVSVKCRKIHPFRIGVVYNRGMPECFDKIKACQLEEFKRVSVHKCFYMSVPTANNLAKGVEYLCKAKTFTVIIVLGMYDINENHKDKEKVEAFSKEVRETVKQVPASSRHGAVLITHDVFLNGDDPTQEKYHVAGTATAYKATELAIEQTKLRVAQEKREREAREAREKEKREREAKAQQERARREQEYYNNYPQYDQWGRPLPPPPRRQNNGGGDGSMLLAGAVVGLLGGALLGGL